MISTSETTCQDRLGDEDGVGDGDSDGDDDGDVCIIGLKSRKRPRRLAFLTFQLVKKPSKNSLNRFKEAKNDA